MLVSNQPPVPSLATSIAQAVARRYLWIEYRRCLLFQLFTNRLQRTTALALALCKYRDLRGEKLIQLPQLSRCCASFCWGGKDEWTLSGIELRAGSGQLIGIVGEVHID